MAGRLYVFTEHLQHQMSFDSALRAAQWVSLVGAVTMIVIFSFAIIRCIKKSNYHSEAKDELGQAICCVSICFFMLHPTIGIFGWTNQFVPLSYSSCNAIYITAYLCYGFGKVSMYWLFIWKIKYILSRDMGCDLWFLFILSGLIPTILRIWWAIVVFDDVKVHSTAEKSLNYCFPNKSLSSTTTTISWLSFSFHVLFSSIILFFYICKISQIGNLAQNQDQSEGGQSRNKVVEEFGEFLQPEVSNEEIVAAFWVVIVTLATTFIMTLGMRFERNFGFYLSLDSVVNCIFIFRLCFGWCSLCSNDTKIYKYDSIEISKR